MAAAMIQSFDADQSRYELICVSRLGTGHSSDQALRRRKPRAWLLEAQTANVHAFPRTRPGAALPNTGTWQSSIRTVVV